MAYFDPTNPEQQFPPLTLPRLDVDTTNPPNHLPPAELTNFISTLDRWAWDLYTFIEALRERENVNYAGGRIIAQAAHRSTVSAIGATVIVIPDTRITFTQPAGDIIHMQGEATTSANAVNLDLRIRDVDGGTIVGRCFATSISGQYITVKWDAYVVATGQPQSFEIAVVRRAGTNLGALAAATGFPVRLTAFNVGRAPSSSTPSVPA